MKREERMDGERAMMEGLEERRLMSVGGMLVAMGDGSVRQEAPGTISTSICPSDPSGNTIYISTAGGGVWKTENGGSTVGLFPRLADGSGR